MDMYITVFWYGTSALTALCFTSLALQVTRWTVREITGKNKREAEMVILLDEYRASNDSLPGKETEDER